MDYTIRTDARNLPEGMDVAQLTLSGLAKETWLVPNMTYSLHKFDKNGVLYIPKVVRGDINPIKDLCATITTSTTNSTDSATLIVDRFAYATIGSCFQGANLVSADVLSAFDKAELDKIKDAYQRNLLKEVVTKASTPTAVVDKDEVIAGLRDVVNEFFIAHNKQPDLIVVSADVLKKIEDKLISYGGLDTVKYALNGFAGSIQGVPVVIDPFIDNETVVGTGKGLDYMVLSKQAINVALATQREHVSLTRGSLDVSQAGTVFKSSLFFREVVARQLEVLVDVILPYGIAIDENLVLGGKLV